MSATDPLKTTPLGPTTPLGQLCRTIRLLVLDVDGVLTSGLLTPAMGDVPEWKAFHVRDGLAIKAWRDQGRTVAILTGRSGSAVENRARELGVTRLVQKANPKTPAFEQLLRETGHTLAETCCVGDDVADVPLLRACGLGVAVADACWDARMAAKITTRTPGGMGAVREIVELLMRCQGSWTAA